MVAIGSSPTPNSAPAKRSGGPDESLLEYPGKRARVGSLAASAEPTDSALLYGLAYSAWTASHRYYTAATIPADVSPNLPNGLPPIRRADPLCPSRERAFERDDTAKLKSLELHLMALDALRAALALPSLTEKEKVVIGLLFAKIGFQVVSGLKDPALGTTTRLDRVALLSDVQVELGQCVSHIITEEPCRNVDQ